MSIQLDTLRPAGFVNWFVTLVVMLVMFAQPANAIMLDKVLVVVNEEPITLSEYRARYRQEVLEKGLPKAGLADETIHVSVVEAMVLERLQIQEALARGLSVSDQQVQSGVEKVAQRNNLTIEGLQQLLAKDDVSLEQFSQNIRNQQLIARLVEYAVKSRVKVSDSEINGFVEANENHEDSDEEFEVSHIFVSTADKNETQIRSEVENLEFIRDQLLQGTSFERAVDSFSDNENAKGGYLGWKRKDQLPSVFVRALRSMVAGDISRVLTELNGLHILKLHQKKGGGQLVEQRLVRHILIQPNRKQLTRAEAHQYATDLRDELMRGEDFEKLVRLHSDDRKTIEDGGILGWVNPGELGSVFDQALDQVGKNNLTPVIESPVGFHIMQYTDDRYRDLNYELAQNQAQKILFERKTAQLYRNWLDSLKSESFVEYLIDIN